MFPTSIQDIPVEWLTSVLREAGVLPQGEVIGTTQKDNPAFNSQVAHLTLNFSDDALPPAPPCLLLKLKKEHHGKAEVAFYKTVHGLSQQLPMLAHSYGSAYSAESGNSYLLLDDLSETHVPPVVHGQHVKLNYVPATTALHGIVEATARFHAYFWEHPLERGGDELFAVSQWYQTQAHFERWTATRHQHWEHFLGMEGSWFPAELRRIYERVLAGLPTLWERDLQARVATGKHLTLTNGDCYLGQFLSPKDPARHTTIMVDLDSACMDFGAMDLVYLFATFWTPEQRAEDNREQNALRHYYDILVANGVQGYRWNDLILDYQRMLTLMLFHPVWDQTYQGSNRTYWWPKLQCLTGAYRDWGCEELLD